MMEREGERGDEEGIEGMREGEGKGWLREGKE